ncbi:phosphoribosylanthranilate isomerase [Geoalkalibacter subterraneus]|uniref:N-(5'-phosphoribosyl)anthranilate isomerase n=1 Tax=Geoalkalibacter subterraneus TaxID=483547 RepID=A0A0B5FGE3_9BACT|nr:phosphoribosylanthranilate isomerase [Geoalkalibacter subterraneus]AJF07207.1 N-(5'-phosphoribosyl)anthranilate isomerase [Geoalkalibacter subterraneus]
MSGCNEARVRIKICGITSVEDGLHAARCGADALGFVFYDRSPRCIAPEDACEIVRRLPPFVSTVGLFVNEEPSRIERIAQMCSLDMIQVHGDEEPDQCRIAGRRVIKALRLRDRTSLLMVERFSDCGVLLDAWVSNSYGGTGQCCNWGLAAEAARCRPVILAGGLDPDNVAEAISVVHPFAVDVSSGVESAPGRKDPLKVEAFIRNVNQTRSDQ